MELIQDQNDSDWAGEEFRFINLGDERRNKRAKKVLFDLAKNPQASINGGCENWADTKAAYRLFNSQGVEEKKSWRRIAKLSLFVRKITTYCWPARTRPNWSTRILVKPSKEPARSTTKTALDFTCTVRWCSRPRGLPWAFWHTKSGLASLDRWGCTKTTTKK